jgi:hypothetical protein
MITFHPNRIRQQTVAAQVRAGAFAQSRTMKHQAGILTLELSANIRGVAQVELLTRYADDS